MTFGGIGSSKPIPSQCRNSLNLFNIQPESPFSWFQSWPAFTFNNLAEKWNWDVEKKQDLRPESQEKEWSDQDERPRRRTDQTIKKKDYLKV